MPFSEDSVSYIIKEALKYKNELPWIELKTGNAKPEMIGEYISALANTAALYDRDHALMIWGIDDVSHKPVGTSFTPSDSKIGNQGLNIWLAHQLEPDVQFYFYETNIDGNKVVLLEVDRAVSSPVKFKGIDYIRIDSHKVKLKDYPDTERELWANFSKKPFEYLIALENISEDYILRHLDYAEYFELLSLDLPSNKESIIEKLAAEKFIIKSETGNYNITNLGAILFAKRLSDFPSLERKAVRVIKYNGKDRMAGALKEQVGIKGYANGFNGLVEYINNLLPNNEIMGKALRKVVPMYPELAVRELVANALIHQNFFINGTSPIIEIFDNRMEITNPGTPLIDKNRFIDSPPISRNEKVAAFMRRVGICEERGSGFDKVVYNTEQYQLPAPEIAIYENHTKVILYAHKEYSEMSKEDRMRACYMHACLRWVNREYMTNSTLRERFNISVKNSSMVSRLLKDTVNEGLIKISESSSSDKNRKYIPFWA